MSRIAFGPVQAGRAIGLGAFDFEGVEAVRVQIGTHGLDVERGGAGGDAGRHPAAYEARDSDNA